MAKYGSDSVAAILIDGYDLLAYLTAMGSVKRAELEDTTVLGDPWRKHEDTGSRSFDLSFEGFYDDTATSGINARVVSNNGTAVVACVLADANSTPASGVGKWFRGFEGPVQASYERVIGLGSLHKARIEYGGSGRVEDGIILHALGAETANGDTQTAGYHDGAAASASGAAGYLQVTALTLGTATNLVVKLTHSADLVAWADLGTFTAATAITKQRLAVAAAAATPRRYLGCSWTWTGGAGGGSTATFFVGCHRIGAAQ